MPQEQQAVEAVEEAVGVPEEEAFAALQDKLDELHFGDEGDWDAEPEQGEEATSPQEPAAEQPQEETSDEPAQTPAPVDDRAARAEAQIQLLQQQIAMLQQQQVRPKPEEKPEAKDPLEELAAELDPRLSGLLRDQQAKLQALEQQNRALSHNLQQKEANEFIRDFHGWIDEVADSEYFGDHAAMTPEQRTNRSETLMVMDGLRHAYRNAGVDLSAKELFEKATKGVRAKTSKPAPAPKAQAKQPAKKEPAAEAPKEEKPVPAELKRRQEAYKAVALKQPTQRERDMPDGDDKAARNLARFMKERRINQDEDLESFPE